MQKNKIENMTLDLRDCRVENERPVLNLRASGQVQRQPLFRGGLNFLRKTTALVLILLTVGTPMRVVFAAPSETYSEGWVDEEVASVESPAIVNEASEQAESTLVENPALGEISSTVEEATPVSSAEPIPEISSESGPEGVNPESTETEILEPEAGEPVETELQTNPAPVSAAPADDTASASFVEQPFESVSSSSEVLLALPVVENSSSASSDISEMSASSSEQFELPDPDSMPEEVPADDVTDDTASGSADDIVEEQQEVIPEQPAVDIEQLKADLTAQLRSQIEQEMKNNCTELEQIGYYCVTEQAKAVISDSENQVHDILALSTKPEGERDSEIFLRDGEDAKRITDNDTDDLFPAISPSKRALVWQSFVKDHWEIFRYDVGLGVTEQITHGKANNFNPQTDGSTIVWHGWADDNWEIFMARPASAGWNITRLTSNIQHDMFPRVAAGMVVWQSFNVADSADVKVANWNIFSYDMISGAVSQISSGEGRQENPRLTVVWDQQYGEGEKRVISRDLGTGKILDMTPGRVPGGVPAELPPTPAQQEQATLPFTVTASGSLRGDEQVPPAQ